MFSIYTLFKFIHVAAVIIWIGGVFALTVINARLAGEKEQVALLSLSRLSNFYGKVVIGPAAIITLIAGIATAAPKDPRVRALQGRLTTLNMINLLLLFSVVGAMVFKPTL